MQKIFRCAKCQRGMRVVGSTGSGKEVERVVRCPYCKTKNKVTVAERRQFQRAAHRHALGAFSPPSRHGKLSSSFVPGTRYARTTSRHQPPPPPPPPPPPAPPEPPPPPEPGAEDEDEIAPVKALLKAEAKLAQANPALEAPKVERFCVDRAGLARAEPPRKEHPRTCSPSPVRRPTPRHTEETSQTPRESAAAASRGSSGRYPLRRGTF